MTEQEAEALAARLERIWEPRGALTWEFVSQKPTFIERFYCSAEWAPCIWFEYYWWERVNSFVFESSREVPFAHEGREHVVVGRFRCLAQPGRIESIFPVQIRENEVFRSIYNQFCDQYLDSFRRNCWLSGCPIEASAHEKAEWMQGFSREEIEAWNLKM